MVGRSPSVVDKPLVADHLDLLLASAAFRSSKRSQDFLRYVVEKTLAGESGELKERLIGAALFHRKADYDTGDDAIVRVAATEVRRRLAQYYLGCGNDHRVKIDLPPGSYIPEFQFADEQPFVADCVPAQEQKRRRLVPVLLACAVVLLGVLVWGAISRSKAPPASVASGQSFYTELLGPIASDASKTTYVVLSNPRLLLYSGSREPKTATATEIPVSGPLESALNPTANDTRASEPYHYLAVKSTEYTGIGEASAAFQIAALLQSLGRQPRLTQARFLNWDSARKEHLVLLGSPNMSAWTQQTLQNPEFVIDHDEIVNRHPRGGEPSRYRLNTFANAEEDYGLIWMAQFPSGSRLLTIGALTSAGTAGTGEFLCDRDHARAAYDKLKAMHGGTVPASWQMLVKVQARDNVPVHSDLVALR